MLLGEKLYLSPILDLYSGDIVTYTLSDSPNLLMATTILEQAFQKISDNTGLLLTQIKAGTTGTTITVESRQDERACRLHYTDSKPY